MSDINLTENQKTFIDSLPADGKVIGNKKLRVSLGWLPETFWAVKTELLSLGVIGRGKGKGGSVYRKFTGGVIPVEEPKVEEVAEVCPDVDSNFPIITKDPPMPSEVEPTPEPLQDIEEAVEVPIVSAPVISPSVKFGDMEEDMEREDFDEEIRPME